MTIFEDKKCIQCELACQKTMKKQSDTPLRGGTERKGFCCCLKAGKQNAHHLLAPGIWRSRSRCRKRQIGKTWNPSRSVPFACVPGTRPAIHLFLPVVHTGSSTGGIPFAPSLQQVPCVFPSSQVASLPLGHFWV